MLARPCTSPPMPPKARNWPRYLKWRDGRPRWEPGPALRTAGHRGRDLKDDAGNWLSRGAAVDAADAINVQIEAGAVLAAAPAVRTVGALLDHILAMPKYRDDGGAGVRLAHTTVLSRRSHFKLIRAWAGDVPVAAIRRDDVNTFYDSLVEGRGLVMANRTVAALAMAMEVARADLEWITHNRAARLETAPEPGRLVMWTPEETATFIACADWMGMEDIADAHIIALMTAQRRGDVLALPELAAEHGIYRVTQAKTGRVAYVPETRLLTARLKLARARKTERWPGVTYRHEIISTRTGAPFARDGSTFTHEYRMVRAVASGLQDVLDAAFPIGVPPERLTMRNRPFTPMPSIWDKRFADLRDTAVTLLYEATGGDKAKVANISGHSLSTIDAIIEKHYFVRHAALSRDAGGMLEDLMQRIGYAG